MGVLIHALQSVDGRYLATVPALLSAALADGTNWSQFSSESFCLALFRLAERLTWTSLPKLGDPQEGTGRAPYGSGSGQIEEFHAHPPLSSHLHTERQFMSAPNSLLLPGKREQIIREWDQGTVVPRILWLRQ